MRWRPQDLDRLERAIDEGARIQLSRRGSEYVIQPRELRSEGATEVIVAVHPNTGDEMRFALDEIDHFSVLY
ncbi:MAG TPA: hypothetical protein VHG51_04000 [Longimicrobiaceae bacterium]|nr:hypothetical protein [Longimicrobiaceae bacterium]